MKQPGIYGIEPRDYSPDVPAFLGDAGMFLIQELDGSADDVGAYDALQDLPAHNSPILVAITETAEYFFGVHPDFGLVPRLEVLPGPEGVVAEYWPTYEELGLSIDEGGWCVPYPLPTGDLHWLAYVPPTPDGGFQMGPPGKTRAVPLPGGWVSMQTTTVREWNMYAAAKGLPLKPTTATRRGTEVDISHHPVTEVSWYDACAWCEWAGLALPSEELWEWAARGPDGRTYPWGNAPPDDDNCVSSCGSVVRDGTDAVLACPAGDGPFGHRQMVGNVWVWTSSPWTT